MTASAARCRQGFSGARVEFVETAPGRFELIAATNSARDLKGMFGKAAKAVSIEEMNVAIAARGACDRRCGYRVARHPGLSRWHRRFCGLPHRRRWKGGRV